MKTASIFLATVSATAISASPLRSGGHSMQVTQNKLSGPAIPSAAVAQLISEGPSSPTFEESIEPAERSEGTAFAKENEGMRRRRPIKAFQVHARESLSDLEKEPGKSSPAWENPPEEISPQLSGLDSIKAAAEVPTAPADVTKAQYKSPDAMTVPTQAIEPRETHLKKKANIFDACGVHL